MTGDICPCKAYFASFSQAGPDHIFFMRVTQKTAPETGAAFTKCAEAMSGLIRFGDLAISFPVMRHSSNFAIVLDITINCSLTRAT